jgi:transposase
MRKLPTAAGFGDWGRPPHLRGRVEHGEVRCHDGAPLRQEWRERLLSKCERLALVEQQVAALEKTRQTARPALTRQRSDALARLRGIGVGVSRVSRVALDLFWRKFNNRHEVSACVGLYRSLATMTKASSTKGSADRENVRRRLLVGHLFTTSSLTQIGVRVPRPLHFTLIQFVH